MIMRSLDWKVHRYCGNPGDIESLVEELRLLPSHKKYSPLKFFSFESGLALHQWLSIINLLRALSFLSPNLQTTKMMMLHFVVHLNGFGFIKF